MEKSLEMCKKASMKFMACFLAALTLIFSVPVSGSGNVFAASGFVGTSQSSQSGIKGFWNKYKKAIIAGVVAVATTIATIVLIDKYGKSQEKKRTPANLSVSVNEPGNQNVYVPDPSCPGGSRLATKADIIYNDFKDKTMSAPGVGPVVTGFGVLTCALVDLGAIAGSLSMVDGLTWTAKSMKAKFDNFTSWLKKKLVNEEEISCKDSVSNLEKLFKEIKGQEKAKEEISSIVFGIVHAKERAKLAKEKYNHADILYFAGPSGVGKTMMAEGLAKYKILSTHANPFYISASEIDKEDSKETVIDQLFGLSTYNYGSDSGNSRVMTKPKNLVKYINDNPGGIVVIDEYDKMWSPALDEVFRTAHDRGTVNVKGQTIDCSGITFILTSNESSNSIHGIPDEKTDDDGTYSRTKIVHDKSFLNRIHPVEFENLSSKQYAQIIKNEFDKYLVEYWKRPEVAGIDVVIEDTCLEGMAKLVEQVNIGARYIDKLRDFIFAAITQYIYDAEAKGASCKGVKIFVSIDPNTNELVISDKPGETK